MSHTFTRPGVYYVTVTAIDDRGVPVSQTFVQAVHLPLTANRPTASSTVAWEPRAAGNRVWVVNQDNDTASVFNAVTHAKIAEIAVGAAPRSVAVAPNGRIWVTNKQSASISMIDPTSLSVVQTLALPRASQPYGIVFDPAGSAAYVACAASGALLKLDPVDRRDARHREHRSECASSVDERRRTIDLRLALHHSAVAGRGHRTRANRRGRWRGRSALGEPVRRRAHDQARAQRPAGFRKSQGRGIPNYLGPAAISPDGTQAWVPSKQDNVARGTLRDGRNIDFQNTVRAISSRIDMAGGIEDLAARIDHDNAGLASAVAYDPLGVYMFVALETSREIAVVDAHSRWEVFRFDVGRAPQGLAVAPDGSKLFVNNFMDRTVGVFDLRPLLQTGATERAAARDAERRHDRKTHGDRAEGQAVLLRRTRHAPGARSLHELRELSQRRRARRPRLGSHRHGRRPAQHDQPERPRAAWRTASCTGARTSTRCRTSKARSARSPAAPA